MAEEDTLDTFVAPRYRKQRATPSSKETKARVNEAAQFAADMVIPQTPFDAGLMLIPGGKIARKAGAALMALDAGDAEAGPLTKLLKALKGSAQDSEALENAAKEQNMLQGFYRGYAGQNPDTAELFITPQKRVADFYAQKRSSQTGETPHAEMVLIDQLTGKQYGHSTLGTGANPPLTTMARKIKAEDVKGRTQLYGKGGAVKSAVKKIINLFDDGEEVALTAAQRAEAGRKAADLIKAQEQVKASEALGQLMEKGTKRTTTTQSDRTRVGGGNIGGAAFPAISQADPAYAGRVWGVMDSNTAKRLTNLTDPDTAWTTMLGAANQLKSNPIVFDKLKRQFLASMKQGNLSDELAGKINHNLALTFGEGADIRNPKIWREADTFDKRAALAEVMMGQGIAPSKGGVALGGEKSGRGVIFKPTEILKRETEPSLLHGEYGGDVPTYAAGPRLFKIEKESEFRPDLHPGFPTLLRGEDLGVNMIPTPTEVYLPDWHARFKKANPDRAPSYYDLALGVKNEGLPSQEINDAYIRHLIREGYAEGGSVKAPAAVYDPNLVDEIVNSIDEPMGYAEGGTVTGPDFDFKEDPETLRLYKHAMKQFMPNQEDTISTVSTGVQGRVGGGNLSAGIDMSRMTKGQQDQLMKSIAASYNVDLGDVNLNTRLEAPLDAKDVYVGMLNGSIPIGEGRAMLGVQGIKTPYGSDVLGYNAGYSGKVGSGRLNVNVNKPKRGKPSTQVQYQIPFAEGGPVHMGKGGALVNLGKKLMAGSAPTAPRSVSAGDVVNGMMVRKDIPNTSSIGASLSDYSTHGLQEVPMSAFETVGKPRYRSVQEEKYTKELARQIQENKELNPLIVVKDAEGHYILEGGHRFDALRELGIDSFPALMVHDLESLGKKLPAPSVAKARGGPVHMGKGGALAKLVKKMTAGSAVLPAAEREANLKKFIAPSAEKRRMYHGSKEPNIKEFKTRKDMTDESMMTGHYADERDAVFLSPEPDFTKNFSQMGYTDTHQAPTTYPVYVQVEKPFDFDNPEHLKQVKETYKDMFHNPDSEFYERYISPSERSMTLHTFNKRVDSLPNDENNWARIENQDFQDVLKDLGFDSFYTRERGTKNLGVYEPNRIKSATGNRGTYDLGESDINKARGGSVRMAQGGSVTAYDPDQVDAIANQYM
jgi:hypothetical protein